MRAAGCERRGRGRRWGSAADSTLPGVPPPSPRPSPVAQVTAKLPGRQKSGRVAPGGGFAQRAAGCLGVVTELVLFYLGAGQQEKEENGAERSGEGGSPRGGPGEGVAPRHRGAAGRGWHRETRGRPRARLPRVEEALPKDPFSACFGPPAPNVLHRLSAGLGLANEASEGAKRGRGTGGSSSAPNPAENGTDSSGIRGSVAFAVQRPCARRPPSPPAADRLQPSAPEPTPQEQRRCAGAAPAAQPGGAGGTSSPGARGQGRFQGSCEGAAGIPSRSPDCVTLQVPRAPGTARRGAR